MLNIKKLNVFAQHCSILAICCVELYRKISSLSLVFPLDSVMLRFSDVTNTSGSSAKFTRSSSTRAHLMLDRRSEILDLLLLLHFMAFSFNTVG